MEKDTRLIIARQKTARQDSPREICLEFAGLRGKEYLGVMQPNLTAPAAPTEQAVAQLEGNDNVTSTTTSTTK